VPGLLHWWDARSVSGSPGDYVATWADQQGGQDFVRVGDGLQYYPTIGATGPQLVANDPAVEYRATLPTLPAQHTVVWIGAGTTGAGGHGVLTADGSISGPVGFIINVQGDESVALWDFTAADAPGNTQLTNTSIPPGYARTEIRQARFLIRNGTQIAGQDLFGAATPAALAAGATRSSVLVQLGPDASLPNFLGFMFAVLIYDHALSPTEIAIVNSIAAAQFGLPYPVGP